MYLQVSRGRRLIFQTYPLLAALELMGLPMTILSSGIPAYEFISITEVEGQLDPESNTKD
jgi:hypothetical protein